MSNDPFDVVDRKLSEARAHLHEMGQVMIHPSHKSGFPRQLAVMMSSAGTIIHHPWQEHFDRALNAFLSSTRSVPDIIFKRCGYDKYAGGKNWLQSLDSNEQDRRRQFHDQFESKFKPFCDHPLSVERKEVAHWSGVAHWEVRINGHFGRTYVRGPTTRLPNTDCPPPYAGEDAALAWITSTNNLPLVPSWPDFWWVIPHASIHDGQTFTLPPW
ncbi:MAG: hypothetical protein HY040_04180 [Planctomycetes bacterium]|nr:hypothetical protein [Planctomycetota bacterium]